MSRKKKKGISPVAVASAVGLLLLLMPKSVAKKSYLGDMSLPRGIRNNNPGNLVITGINWEGKVPFYENTDGKFEQFEIYPYGVRAMLKDLLNDIREQVSPTISSLISEYAPPPGNNTEAYVSFVERATGWPRNIPMDDSKETLRKLSKAIAEFENGRPSITDADFNYAWGMV